MKANLTTTGWYSDVIPVGTGASIMAASCSPRPAFTWSSAVLTLQWTVDADYSVWHDYGSFTLTSSVQGRARMSVAGVLAVRWRCSTAEAANDSEATLDYLIT